MIEFNHDGTVTFVDDSNPERSLTVAYDAATYAQDAATFFGPQPVARREIAKSVVQERVNDLGKLGAVMAVLRAEGNEIYYARWFAPNWPNVYADDQGLLLMLNAAGCTAEEIATITA
jgi:hypothetical protein